MSSDSAANSMSQENLPESSHIVWLSSPRIKETRCRVTLLEYVVFLFLELAVVVELLKFTCNPTYSDSSVRSAEVYSLAVVSPTVQTALLSEVEYVL